MELLAEIQSWNLSPFAVIYYGLLAFPLLLLLASARLTGGALTWIRLIVGCGVAAVLYQTWLENNPAAPIRIDAFLISAVLFFLYVTAVIALFFEKRWRGGLLLTLILGGIAAGMAWQWKLGESENQRIAGILAERDRVLFAAQFRDQETYQGRFGPFGGGSDNLPVGHWTARVGSEQTRLIVNANAQVWLFHACGPTECSYSEKGTPLSATEDGAGWQGEMMPRTGSPVPVRITATATGLDVQFAESITQFTKGPPPINPLPRPQNLTYLGVFSDLKCSGKFANLRQIWLWQEAETITAVGIFRTLTAGSRVDNLTPVPMGQGTPVSDDTPNKLQFSWQAGSNLTWNATVDLSAEQPVVSVREGTAEPAKATFQSLAVVEDSFVELAPLTSMDDLNRWFEIVLTGHFAEADIPGC